MYVIVTDDAGNILGVEDRPLAVSYPASHIADVTFSLDTSAYASGDVLADTQEIASAVRLDGGAGVLQSIKLVDKSDQGVAMSVVILAANHSLGTENSAPDITDAECDDVLGIVDVAASDWKDLGGARVATVTGIGLPVKAAAESTSLYIGLINGTGTPTFSASGITAKLGILRD